MSGDAKFMMGVRLLGLIVLSAMLFSPGVFAAPSDRGLFSEVAAADGLDLAGDPAAIRSRLVTVDVSLLGAPDTFGDARAGVADTLTLNFFPDAVFTAVLDRVTFAPSGGFSWIGRLEDVELSQVALLVKDGVMMGDVTAPGVFYRVRHAGDGVHVVHQVDWAAFPPEAEPILVVPPEGTVDEETSAPATDDGSVIDVLVVYTDDVLTHYGGDTAAVESMIDLAVIESNAGYTNSGVAQQLYLVHTAMVSYDESNFNWNTTLSRLRNHGDGYFDNVTEPGTGLRDTYCADEVVLIVKNTTYCGMAYLMVSVSPSFESSAFALVSYYCATGYYSFAHELGHNMGAHHDWYVNTSTAPYPYNHGFVNYSDNWRTIMAYNSRCSEHGTSCSRLNYWSNPDVSYGGDPMGVSTSGPTDCVAGSLTPDPSTCTADNRTVLNNTALTVSNFRASCSVPIAPSAPSPPDGSSMCGEVSEFDWSSVSEATEYHIQVDDDPGFGSPEVDATAADSFYVHGSSLAPDTYYWHVRSSNAAGDGPWSDIWSFTAVTCDERVHAPVVFASQP